MYRIDNATAVTPIPATPAVGPNPNRFFTKGNPGGGIPATVVDDHWLNTVQEEICAVVVAAGLTLDKANLGQLLAAIQLLGAKAHTHTQGSSNATWTVNHNMGSANHHITVRDGNGKIIQPDWDQSTIGANTDTIVFNEAITGTAYVSL
jgi:hypothetical protein